MHCANDLLKKSLSPVNANCIWRTDRSYFYLTETPGVSPGCINVSPCWFQQGHEVNNADVSCCPEISASLKGPQGVTIIKSMRRPSLLALAALRVMHPSLYWSSLRTTLEVGHWAYSSGQTKMYERIRHWALVFTGVAVMANHQSPAHRDPKCCPEWFDLMTSVSNYRSARMTLHNLGIELMYDSGVMVAVLRSAYPPCSGHADRRPMGVGMVHERQCS
ncbi:uncharacterized protein F5891DRAFT_953041 [Suillus fuscotomentosus]|uniref:Uncharacterized protein n=1 Tax=Suillus fuscotomentosus TaxID=1912939 RepID=A0AAD4E5C4_9AGAM|nr:uncharacterized protein F5891DRAFT_953041 [Suillus fuscotomentosus]KAG1900009.1 hypothetical protein F5891DRAFT_953041 [Suillus fuscotomentosus]